MSSLNKHVAAEPRPLPVIILADKSGSMEKQGKIQALNGAFRNMISSFSTESRLGAEIQIALIAFGGAASQALPLTPAHRIADFRDLNAGGGTPMGAAFTLTQSLLEDDALFRRAYRPTLILLSDGLPTDEWRRPLQALRASEQARKSMRLAMSIGADANEDMLRDFIADPAIPLFKASDAKDIHRFFRAVTRTVSVRLASRNPDLPTPFVLPPDDAPEDLDF